MRVHLYSTPLPQLILRLYWKAGSYTTNFPSSLGHKSVWRNGILFSNFHPSHINHWMSNSILLENILMKGEGVMRRESEGVGGGGYCGFNWFLLWSPLTMVIISTSWLKNQYCFTTFLTTPHPPPPKKNISPYSNFALLGDSILKMMKQWRS